MKRNKNQIAIIPDERIINRIFLLRSKKVMLDRDLAELYGVETKVLNQSVKRNLKRFPLDFMFQITKQEFENLRFYFNAHGLMSQVVITNQRSQFVTLKKGRGKHIKYLPYAFTEQGVAMLSSVLNSERAIEVNIQIIRTFTKLRELLVTHTKLRQKIENIEKKYDSKLKQVFEVLKQLFMQEEKPKKRIGFRAR